MKSEKQFGDKEAQPKINKTVKSANRREKRIMRFRMNQDSPHPIKLNKNHCDECGFHIRSEGHLEGAHHNGTVAVCHR